MEDRELLELAAKANWSSELDDVSLRWCDKEDCILYIHADNQDHNGVDREFRWSPLDDDGDALRLAATLNLSIITSWGFDGNPSGNVGAMLGSHEDLRITSTPHAGDKFASWRLSIVLAAAEIGKAMP